MPVVPRQRVSDVCVAGEYTSWLCWHSVLGTHTLSDVGVGAASSYSDAAQDVSVAHARSEVVVGATDWYCCVGLHVEREEQCLSEVAVRAALMNSAALQTDAAEHSRSAAVCGAFVSKAAPGAQEVKLLHTLFDVAVGSALMN